MRILRILLLIAPLAAAGGDEDGAPEGNLDPIRAGLSSPAREIRGQAEARARRLARTDPAGVASIHGDLSLRGQCALLRALAAAGTEHAATVAIGLGVEADQEVFLALLEGLAAGGAKALSAPLPKTISKGRRAAIEELRLRWRVEGALVRLKSPSGRTGHYTGQFERIKELGPGVVPILLDIVTDRQRAFGGAGGAGNYEPIHPGMIRYEAYELREMTANSFSQVLEAGDPAIVKLIRIWQHYWSLSRETHAFERDELAARIAYSLHDLGVTGPAEQHVEFLEDQARSRRPWDRIQATWDLGFVYIRLRRFEEGEEKYREILDSGYSQHVAAYNLACNFSMRSMQEPALKEMYRRMAIEYLLQAEERKFVDWRWMAEDRDLDAIRDHPAYKRILKRLQQKYPGQHKHRVAKKFDEIFIRDEDPKEDTGADAKPKEEK